MLCSGGFSSKKACKNSLVNKQLKSTVIELHQQSSTAFQHRNLKKSSPNYTPNVYIFVEQETFSLTRYGFTVNK